MKYLPLVWAGLWRKRTRTIITLLSILIAFLLFGLLQGINASFDQVMEKQHANRLYVMSRISLIEPLPIAYQARIESVPGVTGVSMQDYFGGYYQDPKYQIASFGIAADRYFALYPELNLAKDQLDAMVHTRTGAVVGAELAKKYGWKIGDKVPLRSVIFSTKTGADWVFDIVGILDAPETPQFNTIFLFNHDYFDEARAFGRGTVGWYVAGLKDPNQSVRIAGEIDNLFVNSPDETRTQSEKEWAQSQLKRIGDINLLADAIVGAVFFTLVFLTWNTMMQSFRERVAEFAVLKTLGFSDSGLLALVLVESLMLCVFAALLGLGAALAISPALKAVSQGVLGLPPSVIVSGIEVSVLLALVSGIVPAWRAKRLIIVDALAER